MKPFVARIFNLVGDIQAWGLRLLICILCLSEVRALGAPALDDGPGMGLPPEEAPNRSAQLPDRRGKTLANDNFHYDPVGKRDPFRPFRDSKIGIGQLITNKTRTPEPLEGFDVKAFEVVAIMWGITRPKALIQDPNKVIHTVIKGMRIGKNDGVVAEIREGEVVVVELFDLNGRVVKESVVLPIKKN